MHESSAPTRHLKRWSFALLLLILVLAVVKARADQTVTVRSGNGALGSQDTQVRVLRYGRTGDITPAAADFISVQTAPFAYIVAPYPTYISQLPSDPSAQWMATTPDKTPESALYAIPFQVTDQVIVSATLDIHYAVDNAINGVYINGMPISGNSYDGDYHTEFRFVRNDIAPLLKPNSTNWLYLNASDYGVIAALVFSTTITTQGGAAQSVFPDHGGNAGNVTVRILGQSFSDAPLTVTLRAAGQPDITGIDPQVIDSTQIVTTFDLIGAAPGVRDVVVGQAGSNVITFPSAFTIEAGGAAQLSIDVIGPSHVRAGREATFYVVVRNDGLIDANFISIETTLENQLSQQLSSQAVLPSGAVSCSGFGSLENRVIPSGGIASFPGTCIFNSSICSLFKSEAKSEPDPCSDENIQALKHEKANLQLLINDLIQFIGILESDLANLQSEINDCGCERFVPICDVLTCAELFAERAELRNSLAETRAELAQAKKRLREIQIQLENCGIEDPPDAEGTLEVCGVTSVDPNSKIGVDGVGQAKYARGVFPLAYTIFFENLATATAPAQEVSVTDQLDPSIDLSTLSLGNIQFGNNTIQVPAGVQNFTTTVDLRPDKNLLVNIKAQLNLGVLNWHFTSIDPDTGQPPTDPLEGFLPPDNTPPEGEGTVSFIITPKQSLPTGTQIRNSATIVFDTNTPISTQTWMNTIDNDKPTSHVLPLPSTESSASFTVHWSGTDVGSGIKDFTIFVSDNGGPFTPFFTDTTETSGPFIGQSGHTYAFYSIARDQTGDVEALKTQAEATTTVSGGPPIAKCKDVTVPTDPGICSAASASINNGSSDPDGDALTLHQSPAGPYALGTSAVTLTATDTEGLSASCSANVTVVDKQPPTIAAVLANPNVIWPPNNKLVPVSVSVSDSDNCDPKPVCKITGITSNEAITSADAQITGNLIAKLRARRLGTGTGRIYTLTVQCTDASGNSSTAGATVSVPHDQGK